MLKITPAFLTMTILVSIALYLVPDETISRYLGHENKVLGLAIAYAALNKETTESADLIIVDEFGPLELSGQGWRSSVDSLLASGNPAILLVVRRELVDSVRDAYADFRCWNVDAGEPGAPDKVIGILSRRRAV